MSTEDAKETETQYAAAVRNFEAAVKLLHKQNFEKAKEILEKLSTGPAEIADRARVYLRLCQQKLQPANKAPKSAEDFYVAGVAELNARRIERAIDYLAKSTKLDPNREETEYALAAAYALRGEADAALEHLGASIRLRPQNRIQARHDDDFRSLAEDSRFLALVCPESMAASSGS